MIYVLELPADAAPQAWFAFDRADFARKVYAADSRPAWEIHDVASVRELLAMHDTTPERAAAADQFPALRRLGASHGWETPFYRADALLGAGALRLAPVDEAEACAAALVQRVGMCRIYWSDQDAGAALEDGTLAPDSQRACQAYVALRGQLIATEVLEGLQD